jgi:hypothetical protein
MSANTKIFQLYFKPEQTSHLDPAFTPYDNTANPRPELREWYIWDKEHENVVNENLDYWGYVSWKFKEKTNLTGQDVFDHINSHPGYDVYLFNPCIVNEAAFPNSWEQGDMYHPNISGIGNTFLKKLGHTDYEVATMLLDRTRTVFANYVVGNRAFWDKFMAFSRQLFTEADKDQEFKHQVFGEGLSNYAHDKSLPNFTFLIERLIPTFLDLENMKVSPYIYNEKTLPQKYMPYIGEIMALSDLKVLTNKFDSDELYEVWNFYRYQFLRKNPSVLGLE